MATHTIGFKGEDTSSAWSDSIWGKIPITAIREGKVPGVVHMFDFANFRTSTNINAAEAYWSQGLKAFGSDGFAISALDVNGGGVTMGSDGDNEGGSVGQMVYPFQIDRDLGRLGFEVRLKVSNITDTTIGVFVGLIDASALSATVPIAAAGTLANEDFVGFHRLEGDGDQFDTVYKAGGVTQVTVQADAVTVVADTFVKLGMLFEPSGDVQGGNRLSFYKNGVRLTSSKEIPTADGTDFPNDVRLGFVLAILNAAGSSPGTVSVSGARIAQLL